MSKRNPLNKSDLAKMNKVLADLQDIADDLKKTCDLNIPGHEELCARRDIAERKIVKLKELFFALEI